MTTATRPSVSTLPSSKLDAKDLIELLRQMMLIRRFEERTAQSYQQGKIGGFCHIYIGQEAVAVGSVYARNTGDPLITAYRDHGHALACGLHPNQAMAEMFGKIDGCAKGKGGSMHLFDRSTHMYGGHAIVGGQCPLGIGLAFATQYLEEDKVTLCYLGDGALNQGAFHESMNLAAIWKLPIIFVVENNGYSMGTSISRGTAGSADLRVKADAYGMRFNRCDGMHVLEVYDCFKAEFDRTRPSLGNDGPCFIEARTYRFQGHSMSDPQKYRTKDEVGQYEERDPIGQLRRHMLDTGAATEEQIDEMDRDAKEIAKEAVRFADESPATPVEELYTDVYAKPYGPFKPTSLPPYLRDKA